MKTRLKLILLILAASIVLPFILGLPMGAIIAKEDLSFWGNVFTATKLCYLFFTANLTLGALLMFIPRIPEPLCIIFGAILYYGTFFLGGILRDFLNAPAPLLQHYIIAFAILSLACYAFCPKD